MAKQVKEIQERASEEVRKSFDLSKFKNKKGLGSNNAQFKEQKWIPVSKAWQKATSLPGIPQGQITVLRGHTNTGKTTTLLECAAACQKLGILPVLIITEAKFSWNFCRQLGFQCDDVIDPKTGEVVGAEGFFLYADRGTLKTIEDVANFIIDILDEQDRGNLPYDLCFLWDSIGSVPCRMSVESKNINAQWDAASLSNNFAKFIDQRIVLSRKITSPYTNSLVCTSKIWVSPPENPMGSPKVNSKGGTAIPYDAALIIFYGNITNSGITKLQVSANGKILEWGARTKVAVEKNHICGLSSKDYLIMTPTGFIENKPKAVEQYRQEHQAEWIKDLGSQEFDMIEEVPYDSDYETA